MASRRFDLARRRRLTPSQRQRLLARYHKGHFTQKAFAAREGIGLSTLLKWLHQERANGQASVSFQEVVLPDRSERWALEVVNPQGWTVRLAQAADAPNLSPLLGALPC
jgi:transposase-like protein